MMVFQSLDNGNSKAAIAATATAPVMTTAARLSMISSNSTLELAMTATTKRGRPCLSATEYAETENTALGILPPSWTARTLDKGVPTADQLSLLVPNEGRTEFCCKRACDKQTHLYYAI
jgi:hypothetical protein